jgi:hypothetical protein
MSPVWFVIMLVLIFGVVAMLTSPWRRGDAAERPVQTDDRVRQAVEALEDLQAARDAKYREIRDAQLDRQTGKLSETDFTAVDGGLRAEAVEILRDLDRAESRLDKLRAAEVEKHEIARLDWDSQGGDIPELNGDDVGELSGEDGAGLEPGTGRTPDAARSRPDRD